jgi:hypothetical protein
MKRYFKWLWEVWFLWLLIFQLLIVIGLDKLNFGLKPDENIRIYGLSLQLLGLIIIVISLKDKFLLFKGFGLNYIFIDWIKRRPKRKNIIIKTYDTNLHITSFVPDVEIRGIIRPNDDLTDIIRYYNEEIEYLHKRIVKTKKELENQVNVINNDIEGLKRRFGDEIKGTKKLVSDSSISNIALDLYGVMTAFIGLICGTIPDFIVKLI